MQQETTYSTIVLWFVKGGSTTQLTLRDTTVTNAWLTAETHGWQRPVWHKPWLYFASRGLVVAKYEY